MQIPVETIEKLKKDYVDYGLSFAQMAKMIKSRHGLSITDTGLRKKFSREGVL